jgi:23S rRNA pseudouridine1911/1915/1917 synthase
VQPQSSLILIIRFKVPENLPQPARTVLGVVQMALKVKRTIAEQLIHEGGVTCHGKALMQTHMRLEAGDTLEMDYAPQPVRQAKSIGRVAERFQIVHDDDYLIVVNKPAGLLTVPTPKREANTLQSQIRKWLSRQQPGSLAVCVHRLDKLVSGLLVFAKSYEAADLIRAQFEERKPQRLYTAIVAGKLSTPQGTIRSYLSTDDDLNRRSSDNPEQGELAITHYRVREVWQDVTLLEIQLETGRRNQIRVHMADLGHPVLGDPRYHRLDAEHPHWPYERIALHAETLAIKHPVSGELMKFVAPWPQEFRDLRKRLRPDSKKD